MHDDLKRERKGIKKSAHVNLFVGGIGTQLLRLTYVSICFYGVHFFSLYVVLVATAYWFPSLPFPIVVSFFFSWKNFIAKLF